MDCSTPGFPVHHHLPELAQTHVHWVSDAVQPSEHGSQTLIPLWGACILTRVCDPLQTVGSWRSLSQMDPLGPVWSLEWVGVWYILAGCWLEGWALTPSAYTRIRAQKCTRTDWLEVESYSVWRKGVWIQVCLTPEPVRLFPLCRESGWDSYGLFHLMPTQLAESKEPDLLKNEGGKGCIGSYFPRGMCHSWLTVLVKRLALASISGFRVQLWNFPATCPRVSSLTPNRLGFLICGMRIITPSILWDFEDETGSTGPAGSQRHSAKGHWCYSCCAGGSSLSKSRVEEAQEAAWIELPILQRTSSAWKADLDPRWSMETPCELFEGLPHDPRWSLMRWPILGGPRWLPRWH